MDGLLQALQAGFELVVGGIPVATTVAFVVQGAKVLGYVDSETAPKAAIIAAGFFGLGWLATYLFSGADLTVAYVVAGLNQYVIGALEAGLLYEVAKYGFAKAGININGNGG